MVRSKPDCTAELMRLGFQPRMLRLELAAAYVGLSAGAFVKAVKAKHYPDPVTEGRRRQWDVRALDAALDRRSGLQSSSPRDESPEALNALIDAAE